MARILLILLAVTSLAHAKLPGESGALWNQQSGAPKTLRPDPTDTKCLRMTGTASGPRICSLDGINICIDMNNNSATCEVAISADGTIANVDQQASGDNRFEIMDNDAAVTPDPTCATKCPVGAFCMLDTDESTNDRWSLCDGPTEVATLADLIITTAWQQPFGAPGGSLLYAPTSNTCDCFICPFNRPMLSISHVGYRPGVVDPDDIVSYGVFSPNGQTRYFNCAFNVTSAITKECANTLSIGPVPIGNNICCIATSAASSAAFRAAGDSELLVMKYTQSCPGGVIPTTLTGNPPTFTRQLSAVPFVDLVFGLATTTSTSSTTSTSNSTTSTSSTTSTTTVASTTSIPSTTSTSSSTTSSSSTSSSLAPTTSTTSTSSTTSTTVASGAFDWQDDFNRAALGTAWTDPAGTFILTNGTTPNFTAVTYSTGTSQTMFWNANQVTSNAGMACVQLTSFSTTNYPGPCLVAAGGTSAVCCIHDTATPTTIRAAYYTSTAGWIEFFGTGLTGTSLTTNDWIIIRRTGVNTWRCAVTDGGVGAESADISATGFQANNFTSTPFPGLTDDFNGEANMTHWMGRASNVLQAGACGR